MSSPPGAEQALCSRGDAPSSARGARRLILLAGVVLYAAILADAVTTGQTRLLLVIGYVTLMAVAFFRPDVLFWTLVPALALFGENTYGVLPGQSVVMLHSVTVSALNLNFDELLVYPLAAILLVHLALRKRKPAAIPASVWVPCAVTALVFLGYLVAALMSRINVSEALLTYNGKYVMLLVVALWCFAQCLQEPAVRLRLLDVLFVVCGSRAVYALGRYFFAGGDVSDAYRNIGLKVALWEIPDHQLFAFLIAVATAAALLRAVDPKRRYLWLAAAVPMVLTIGLSYRRASLIGVLMALVVLAVLLWKQGGRWLSVATAGTFVAGLGLMSQRFRQGGPLVASLFADVDSSAGQTRVYEWTLAWDTIRKDPLLGGGLMAERQAGIGDWSALFVHNGFLLVWMKLGFAGLAALVSLMVAVALRAWRAARAASPQRFIGLAALAMMPFIVLDVGSGDPLQHARSTMVFALLFAFAVTVAARPEEVDDRTSQE